ncbi:MAG: adenylate/guanylate cyclase domain-containing protein [Terrimicrobiaceae bacterium]
MQLPSDNPVILIVDDTPENVDVLAGILHGHYQIKIALNGPKALKIAQSDSAPALILLDVMMPEMDGYEVCRRLQANERTRRIPVIFVTAKSEDEDEALGFGLGAVDYITKPVSPAIVLARVRTQLALKQSHGRLEDLSLKLARYLSRQVYQSIFEGRQDARIGCSRKKLTVFFSDIVGFANQTEGMESEDVTFILNGYLNRMAGVVLKHGGTLDKFVGDAVLVFFGDPETRGVAEDAVACVRMALEMREAIGELNREWLAKGIRQGFEVRMGISTGFSTVGNFGSDERMDYTIIGKQVNLANRLQAAAQPGEILISQETWLLVRDVFLCVAKEPVQVKGFERAIQTYAVIGAALPEGMTLIEDARPGFRLTLDPAQVGPAERIAVVEKLRAAIASLR